MGEQLSPLIAAVEGTRDGVPFVRHLLWCPGCDDLHQVEVEGSYTWTWDGNVDTPTYSPSLLVDYGTVAGVRKICHSFIQAGQWQFLGDSTHALAGQTVPMEAMPDGYL